jgi:hypothetical protein
MASYGLSDFQADVEADIDWRTAEVRAVKRSISTAQSDIEVRALRRALITLLYAHLEGGFKVAVSAYIRVVNEARLDAAKCNPHLAASSWAGLFKDLVNANKKSDHFRNSLPDDSKLHAFARHAEFVSGIRKFNSIDVVIDETKIVDTEGNIDQTIISKILFRLGFSPDALERRFSDLQYLRRLRNPIAHGENETATEKHCEKYEETVFQVLTRVRDLLTKAITEKSFMRKAS